MNTEIVSYEVEFYGKVQNVGFRYHCSIYAKKYNLVGFVKNIENRVEGFFQGRECDIDDFIEIVRKNSGMIYVEEIIMRPAAHRKFDSFEIH